MTIGIIFSRFLCYTCVVNPLRDGGTLNYHGRFGKYFSIHSQDLAGSERKGNSSLSRFNILSERTFGGNKRYILFISTGNTCRAPMAYGIMKKMLEEAGVTELDIRTGGVMTVPGLMPTQECRQLLQKEGIDISMHRSCQLTPELIKRASLVLGMTSFHVQIALRMAECARGKTYLLKEYAGFDGKNDQVQDPMGCTLEVYKKVLRDIRGACKRMMRIEAVLSAFAPRASTRAFGDSALAGSRGEKANARRKKQGFLTSPASPKAANSKATPGKKTVVTEKKSGKQEKELEVSAAPRRRAAKPPAPVRPAARRVSTASKSLRKS